MPSIIVWNEADWSRKPPHVQELARATYPDGINPVIAEGLRQKLGAGYDVGTAELHQPAHGLDAERLGACDVLVWWGHNWHQDVDDEVVRRIRQRVLDGMGLVALHSAHYSKPFTALLGTGGHLAWRNVGEREILWFIEPGHPLAAGFSRPYIDIDQEEMYGEPFAIPAPDELIGISHFAGGEVFRSICSWRRGRGRLVYLRPGDERYPTFYRDDYRHLLANAVRYALPTPTGMDCMRGRRDDPLATIAGEPSA